MYNHRRLVGGVGRHVGAGFIAGPIAGKPLKYDGSVTCRAAEVALIGFGARVADYNVKIGARLYIVVEALTVVTQFGAARASKDTVEENAMDIVAELIVEVYVSFDVADRTVTIVGIDIAKNGDSGIAQILETALIIGIGAASPGSAAWVDDRSDPNPTVGGSDVIPDVAVGVPAAWIVVKRDQHLEINAGANRRC
jgi:hypothetical protein